ncbi:MAG: phosphoribosylaminoimidazolesuccinocarboxamide synthase [Desulfobacteraceae bacterium]|nr:phosphoribosylaminoimidazolesuccinocarboxamide synthase [Desulfobacteraceae bacterium]
MTEIVTQTQLDDLKLAAKGKVRDIYEIDNTLLMITSDRLSAFDVVLPDPIPDKGSVLTQISVFWFEKFKDIVNNHLISADVDQYPEQLKKYSDILENRSMLVKKAEPLPVECIVRGYITGSGWKSYQDEGHVCGIKLPTGLKESEKLAEPLFTPSSKAEVGDHDINISFADTIDLIGKEKAEKLRDLSLTIYNKGADIANEKGIIIADTKFEFGILDNEIILIDEVLTPDSSRFWPKATFSPGKSQKSFDKQAVRDWLTNSGWNKKAPGPKLPAEIIQNTSETYKEIFKLLTGKDLN